MSSCHFITELCQASLERKLTKWYNKEYIFLPQLFFHLPYMSRNYRKKTVAGYGNIKLKNDDKDL
jgi:hypothetical protein